MENGGALFDRIEGLLARWRNELPIGVRIDRIRFMNDDVAVARIAEMSPSVAVRRYDVRMTRIDSHWVVSQDSFIAILVPLIG